MRTVFMVMGEIVVKRGGLTRVMLDRASLFVKNGYKVKIMLLNWNADLEQAMTKLQELGRIDPRVEFFDLHTLYVLNESNKESTILKNLHAREESLFEPGYEVDLTAFEREQKAVYLKDNKLVKVKKWKKGSDGTLVLDWIMHPDTDDSDKCFIDYFQPDNLLLYTIRFSNTENTVCGQTFTGVDGKLRIIRHIDCQEENMVIGADGREIIFESDEVFWAYILEYACRMEEEKPIVIIDGMIWSRVGARVSKDAADVVMMGHGSHLMSPFQDDSGILPQYDYAFNNWMAYAAIVTLTEEQKQNILARYPDVGNIYVIPNCVPDARIPPASDFASKDTCKAICITRLAEEKNLEAMLHSFAIVVRKNKAATLDIYGVGEEQDKLVELTKKLGLANNVFFKGYAGNIDAAYRSALISIQTSKTEGLPLALLESMFNGVPVVAFDCNFGPRDIISNGEDGFLVERGDIGALAEKILYAFEHLEEIKELGLAARKKVTVKFGEKVHMQKWEGLLELIGLSGRSAQADSQKTGVEAFGKPQVMRGAPKISVIMPVYNNSAYIEESVHSILNQTMEDLELLVFDDCSIDETPEILSKINDRRLVVSRMDRNSGPGRCRNAGLDMARGKYIALMDSDDVSVRERLEVQFGFMEKNSKITVCGGNLQKIGNAEGFFTYPNDHDSLKARILFHSPFGNPVVMFRGDFLRENRIKYREDMSSCSDYELWLRLAHSYEQCKFANLPLTLALYRVHGTNITQSKTAKWRKVNFDVKRPYLENLCGDVHEEELQIHKLIFDQKYAADKKELTRMKTWLLRMRKANDAKSIYKKDVFCFWLAHKFMEICLNSLHLGPWAVKNLISYPDSNILNLPSGDIEKLLATSL